MAPLCSLFLLGVFADVVVSSSPVHPDVANLVRKEHSHQSSGTRRPRHGHAPALVAESPSPPGDGGKAAAPAPPGPGPETIDTAKDTAWQDAVEHSKITFQPGDAFSPYEVTPDELIGKRGAPAPVAERSSNSGSSTAGFSASSAAAAAGGSASSDGAAGGIASSDGAANGSTSSDGADDGAEKQVDTSGYASKMHLVALFLGNLVFVVIISAFVLRKAKKEDEIAAAGAEGKPADGGASHGEWQGAAQDGGHGWGAGEGEWQPGGQAEGYGDGEMQAGQEGHWEGVQQAGGEQGASQGPGEQAEGQGGGAGAVSG
eukprot:TRINITY_DN3267_c0_g1_i1.p2 TRINITY_DN3267_c0_g1~~TRINITY_DN3267_c0_g1_i1.p2  ORF type:complete len:316 (+),score=89.75 TRINITY_DN3267_c0_g1_i1:120-1067(+)